MKPTILERIESCLRKIARDQSGCSCDSLGEPINYFEQSFSKDEYQITGSDMEFLLEWANYGLCDSMLGWEETDELRNRLTSIKTAFNAVAVENDDETDIY